MFGYIRTNENPNCENKVKTIRVNVNKETGEISVKNDGEGITKGKINDPVKAIVKLDFVRFVGMSHYCIPILSHILFQFFLSQIYRD